MPNPYNVLHVLSTARLSGAERIVQFIARHLDRQKFNPLILCTGNPLCKVYEQEGHRVLTMASLTPLPLNILKFRSILKNRNIQLIHAHDHRASLLALMSGGLNRRIPLISHIHNTNPWMKTPHPFKLVEILVRNRYDLSIACSETVNNYFLTHHPFLKPGKIITITNGIEIKDHPQVDRTIVAKSLGIPPNGFIFGTVGRLNEQKGLDILLPSFKIVANRWENTYLLIVGTGSMEQKLKKLTADLGLTDRVVFAGYREDVYDIFQLMNVFVLSSRWEGLPMVLMEAMAQNVPVISTDVGGIRELVHHEETGFLIPSGNQSLLAEKMICCYEQREWAQKMARAGRELVINKCNVKNQVKKIENIYLSLLKGDGSAG